jgi:hypothetical protein
MHTGRHPDKVAAARVLQGSTLSAGKGEAGLDPANPDQNTELVYPVVTEAIVGA